MLYLLHGAGGDENEWLQKGGLRETMDALVARRVIHPMVVVMPGHRAAWWVDGAAEKGETALMKEVLPHAESRYRIDATRANRLVAGLSAGGYGALNLVMKYPQLFAATAILSPAIYDPVPPSHSSGVRNPPFQRDGKFDPALWQSLNYTAHIEGYKKSARSCRCTSTRATRHLQHRAARDHAVRASASAPDRRTSSCASSMATTSGWSGATRCPDALAFLNARIAGPR